MRIVPLARCDLTALLSAWAADADDPLIFRSAGWFYALASVLPESSSVRVVTGDNKPLAFLGDHKARRHRLLTCRQWVLNESGDPLLDRIAPEYNGILTSSDQPTFTAALFDTLMKHQPGTDELVVRNATAETAAALRHAAAANGWGIRQTNVAPSAIIDLDTIRAAGGDAVATSGRNTRAAIRRAFRLYAADGDVRVDRAGSAAEAIDWFDRMKVMHVASWQNRAAMHAFSNPYFEPFHHTLIRKCFDQHWIDMLRVTAGRREIGYLYNFSNDGWSMAYQSGFSAAPDNRWKPGLVSHCAAIAFCIDRGDYRYDFLAGAARYKSSLANDTIPMESLVAFAPHLHLRVENTLRRWRAGWKGKRARSGLLDDSPGDTVSTD